MEQQVEQELVRQAQNGDREALGLLWEEITPKLFGYLVNVLKDKVLAEDVLQNTWLKAAQKLPSFQPRGYGLSAWLFAIARNECKQHWRKPATTPLLDNQDFAAANEQGRLEATVTIDNLLNHLPQKDQEIIRLRYISDLSVKDIAKVLNITSISVRVKLHRIISKLKQFTEIEKLGN